MEPGYSFDEYLTGPYATATSQTQFNNNHNRLLRGALTTQRSVEKAIMESIPLPSDKISKQKQRPNLQHNFEIAINQDTKRKYLKKSLIAGQMALKEAGKVIKGAQGTE